MLRAFRELTLPARLLVVNQLGINLGFYLVLPFLATHMAGLGYAAATIGLVLALRNLSQQGLFLIGGSAADRIGARPVIILGCAMRIVAFGLFVLFDSLPGLVAAAVLTGLAGAFFNPAVRAYLMQEAGDRRAEVFSVFNVFGNVGALLGPLLGAALLSVDFRLVAGVACALFTLLTVAQLFALPARAVEPQERGLLGSWGEVVTNRRFLVFALGGAGYFSLFNQLYLAFPVEAQRVSGVAGAVSAVFVVSTVVGITGQVRITAWCKAHWTDGRSMAVGLVLMGVGFVPIGLAAPFVGTAAAGGWTTAGSLAVTPVLLGTVVFAVGQAMTNPFTMALLPTVGSRALAGTYYGWFYLVAAAVVAITTPAIGGLFDRFPDGTGRWVPFAVLLGIGLTGGAVIAWMQRTGRLAARPAPTST
ncbi:MFS transporter [Pseudonocardia phyllosphaerae]|uniref:MFS transporter n=1 Tax=Pseudonocardia phyllosphaerae TaxID=3390502 RepID=UPI00397A8860